MKLLPQFGLLTLVMILGACTQVFELRERQISIPPGGTSITTVACLEGETVTGGGFQINDDPQLNVWENAPAGLTGWRVSIGNYNTINRTGRVFAMCTRPEASP